MSGSEACESSPFFSGGERPVMDANMKAWKQLSSRTRLTQKADTSTFLEWPVASPPQSLSTGQCSLVTASYFFENWADMVGERTSTAWAKQVLFYFSSVFPSKTFTDVEDKQSERSQAFFTFKHKLRLQETAGFMGFRVIKVNIWIQNK